MRGTTIAIVTTCLSLIAPAAARAAPSSSASPAHTFVALLNSRGIEAFAAPDPDEPGRFVAALSVPHGDLLVVSARQPSTDAVAQRIAADQFRDVYLDLQATPTPQGKFFVQDSDADGLSSAPQNDAIDIVYEDGTKTTVFNGDAKAQHLSRDDYDARFDAADRRYAHALTVLITALQSQE
jgi:hypothetical protein